MAMLVNIIYYKPKVPRPVAITGIVNVNNFGVPAVLGNDNSLLAGGVQNTNAFGSPTLQITARKLFPSGVVNTNAFGTPIVNLIGKLQPEGVVNTNAFGAPVLDVVKRYLRPTGVVNANDFGAPELDPQNEQWQVIGTWDHSVSGNTASPIDFTSGFTDAEDLMLVFEDVTKSAAAQFSMRFSVDGGATFFTTSGNYRVIAEDGSASNATQWFMSNEATTAARSGIIHIPAVQLAVPKRSMARQSGLWTTADFVGSLSPINALRFIVDGGGNFTGGKITLLAYK